MDDKTNGDKNIKLHGKQFFFLLQMARVGGNTPLGHGFIAQEASICSFSFVFSAFCVYVCSCMHIVGQKCSRAAIPSEEKFGEVSRLDTSTGGD